MRDRAAAEVRVPQVRGARQELARVEVQVLLGVGADVSGRRQEERDVREDRQAEVDEQRVPARAVVRDAHRRDGLGTGARFDSRHCVRSGWSRRASRGEHVERAPGGGRPRVALGARAGTGAQPVTELLVAQHGVEVRDELLVRRREEARDPVLDRVAMAGDVGDDRRRPARGRLRDRHPPALTSRGAREHPRAPVEVDELGVGDPARELDVRAGVAVLDVLDERLAFIAFADDHRARGPGGACAARRRRRRAGGSA